MTVPEFEPTPGQTEMARVLHDVGTRCMQAENAWAAALANLTTCVRAAREAGIPREDVIPLVTGGRALGGATRGHLRKIIRLYYS